MRITKDPEERKVEILDTAIEIFCEKGYDKTSISDIAKKMNVAQGLCYRYFKSKEEIFDSAVEHYADMQVSEMKKILLDNSISLKEKIAGKFDFIEIEKKYGNYYKVFHGANSKKIHTQLSMTIGEKIYPVVCQVIKDEAEKGSISLKGGDVETVSSFLLYGQIGILFRSDITNDEKQKRVYKFVESILY